MHLVYNIIRHRKGHHTPTSNNAASGQTKEIEAALGVSSWTQRKHTNGVRCHSIVMFFVILDILSRLKPEVSGKVHPGACNDALGTPTPTCSVRLGECIQPKHRMFCHLNHKSRQNVVERQGIINALHAFFNCSDILLYVSDMFLSRSGVERDFALCEFTAEQFKFTIHQKPVRSSKLQNRSIVDWLSTRIHVLGMPFLA